ncbi:HNH endonuclease family protein (plasmid) [Streptomyces sp. NBC_00053]|uniref:HNH endonuclease family protein n=1 Tax=unclassified Streptomyces TaxID=2593676 RepID=UPI00224D4E47|nr:MULTISPECIES: HNH endonuclease family protein [unclassified Streptomyces]MCX4400144.1 HNH endonuclease family protein [Streptomyces sp. NBC_01767]MCX5506191.1 HNH endonuclease family protein [Streptomyces sp. NBC_00052]MCX5554106.1 HNH endonuclease family protein [Streptomyces sp. NBC_00051]
MPVRRFVPIAAVVLVASLAACNPSATKSESDSKPAASASAGTDRDEAGSSAAPGAPAGGNGLSLSEAIAKIPAADEVRDGYKRDSFKHWIDEDGDSCSTRNEVLLAEAVKAPEQGARCALTGGEWRSYYDEVTVTAAGKLDIDHMVPLAEAWDSGASKWDADRRMRYANDLGAERSLVAVTAKTNRSKADKDPSEWMPPTQSAKCTYLADWTATKLRWKLSADERERAALETLAKDCPGTAVKYEAAP